jgi:hypothetical protein
MKVLQKIFSRFQIIGELFHFLWERKLWWLIPFIAILLLFGLLFIFVQSTGLGPFVYPLI